MIVMLYFFFMLPGMVAVRRFAPSRPEIDVFVMSSLTVLGLFLVAEVIELLVLRYRTDRLAAIWSLFLLRVAAVTAHWLAFSMESAPIRHNPVFSGLIPLIVFYAYFLMRKELSLVLLTFAVLPIAVDFFRVDGGVNAPGPDRLGFLVFRAVVIVFFYLLAWFWDTERRRQEENRRLVKELHTSQAQLRSYAERVGHTVALEERTRLARDLHDSIGHALTAIGIQLTKAKAYFDVNSREAKRAVEAAHVTAKDAMSDVRESLGSLNGDTQGLKLRESVERLAARLQDAGIVVSLACSGTEDGYNYAVLLGVYRFFQESVTNILKHAEATTVTIGMDLGADGGEARIVDDGIGFDARRVVGAGVVGSGGGEGSVGEGFAAEGFGIPGLIRRFELIGGTLTVTSQPGGGTGLVVHVPRDPLLLSGTHHETDSRFDR